MYDFLSYLQNTTDNKKNPMPKITTSMAQYPTGFMHMDYGAGSYLNVYDDDESPLYTYHNIGITSGSVNVLISKSQGGKTTLAMGMASAIIEPYINPIVYIKPMEDIQKAYGKKLPVSDGSPFIQIFDTEKTLPIDYAKKIMRYTNKLVKRHVLINPISTDRDLIQGIKQHAEFKETHMNKICMPILDMFGKPILDYPPTVIIVDSMSQLILEEYGEVNQETYAKLTQNTAGAKRARIISALYSEMVNYAKKYNIIIFSINHINKMPAMNGIPVKQYRGLRAGETIGGGERAIYLSANILRLDVIKSVNTVSPSAINLGDDVSGFISIAKWIKSKSNSKSNECQLVYTDLAGYDPFLSSLWYDKALDKLEKSGNYLYLPTYPDKKFTLKNCREVFAENPGMICAYYDQLRNECSEFLDNPEHALAENNKLLNNIRKDIHDDMKNGYCSKDDAFDMDDIFANVVNA